MSDKKLGTIENSRTDNQRQYMDQTIGQGKCPFCSEHFDRTLNKVIYEGAHWRAFYNPYPYSGTATHIVLATLEHISDISQLSRAHWDEWGYINQLMIAKGGPESSCLPGGGIVMRFGAFLYKF
jgi:diadenosine tetraphosphate (Ap4A) HIT family hydrolase